MGFVGEAIQQRGREGGLAKHLGLVSEAQVGRNDH
jgi:hypothetical protein